MITCCNIEFLLPSSPVCVLDLAKFYSPFPLLVGSHRVLHYFRRHKKVNGTI